MRVSDKFKIGLIGTGRIARAHVEALSKLGSNAQLVALADAVPDMAYNFKTNLGLDVVVYRTVEDLLARTDIDIVDICTPPYVREDLVVRALESGKHVVCEKPFAASLEEYDRMISASEQYGKKVAVMLQSRCSSDVLKIQKLVSSGALGPVLFARAQDHHWRDDPYYAKEWRGTWEYECGGALMNLGIHIFDVFLWIMGSVESVQAESGALAHHIETDDITAAVLRFSNGAIGTFSCTTTYPEEGATMEFGGKYRFVRYPFAVGAVKGDWEGFPDPDPESIEELQKIMNGVPIMNGEFEDVFRNLFTSLQNGMEPLTSAKNLRSTIETVTAVYKAAATGKKISLPITKDDPWYTKEGIRTGMKGKLRREILLESPNA